MTIYKANSSSLPILRSSSLLLFTPLLLYHKNYLTQLFLQHCRCNYLMNLRNGYRYYILDWFSNVELLSASGLAIDNLSSSLSSSTNSSNDIRTWLRFAVTYHQAYPDGFEEFNINGNDVNSHLKYSFELTSNSLTIITWISKVEIVGNILLQKRNR